MTRAELSARDSARLDTVHPDLRVKVVQVLAAMWALGFQMTVTDALRTKEEQQRLYAKGRNGNPGPIVTNADGVTRKSNHQAKDDGYGHAVDCAFLDATLQPSWDEHWPWGTYGLCAQTVGLVWGGAWSGGLGDRPHVELP